jgi:3-oxoacyl-[acyl-carrier protein] reductase
MSGQFEGKVAWVTGGSQGIGKGVVKMFAERGAAVLIGYSSHRDVAEDLAKSIRDAGGQAEITGGDVRDPAVAKAAVDLALERFGKLDILVTSAGVGGRHNLDEITLDDYRHVFDINVWGTIASIQAAAPHMTSPGGKIVTVTSRVALNPFAGAALYAGAKNAVNAITDSFARELGPKGITVNAVAPGLIETERMASAVATRGHETVAITPLGRIGMPDDIAGVVAFLSSDDSKWVTGRVIRADGGIV